MSKSKKRDISTSRRSRIKPDHAPGHKPGDAERFHVRLRRNPSSNTVTAYDASGNPIRYYGEVHLGSGEKLKVSQPTKQWKPRKRKMKDF